MGDPLHEELDVPECMRLLATAAVGRLGYTQAALPAVQPVTYRLTEGAVLIPAVAGSRAAGAIRDGIVALGVDSFGADSSGSGGCGGWAVNVVGPIRFVDGSSLRLEPVLVSGWRRSTAAGDADPVA